MSHPGTCCDLRLIYLEKMERHEEQILCLRYRYKRFGDFKRACEVFKAMWGKWPRAYTEYQYMDGSD